MRSISIKMQKLLLRRKLRKESRANEKKKETTRNLYTHAYIHSHTYDETPSRSHLYTVESRPGENEPWKSVWGRRREGKRKQIRKRLACSPAGFRPSRSFELLSKRSSLAPRNKLTSENWKLHEQSWELADTWLHPSCARTRRSKRATIGRSWLLRKMFTYNCYT